MKSSIILNTLSKLLVLKFDSISFNVLSVISKASLLASASVFQSFINFALTGSKNNFFKADSFFSISSSNFLINSDFSSLS